MDPHTRLHAQLLTLLSQHCYPVDQWHLVTLAWMVMGLLLSQTVSVNGWRDCIPWGDRLAASWQRRCQRWLSNPSSSSTKPSGSPPVSGGWVHGSDTISGNHPLGWSGRGHKPC